MSHTIPQQVSTDRPRMPPRPIRVLALRAVDGAGGGADKIVLRNACSVSPDSVQMAVCFMHPTGDQEFDLADRAAKLGIPHYEESHRGPLDRNIFSKIRRITKNFRPDIIHSHDYKASFIATTITRRNNSILRLATSHGWTGDKMRERRILYPADRFVLKRFPGVIAVSDQIRDTLIRAGAKPERIRVLLNGIDPAEFRRDEQKRQRARQQLGFSPEHIVLGAAGRVEWQKRFDLLIDAFDRLSRSDSRLRLVIAGDGSLLESLRRDVQRRGLQKQCRLLGHCPDMQQTYQAFDMLVQSSDYEGTPTVVVEAMALQIPIVATDAGGTSQLVEDGTHGYVVPCRDVGSLCQAIQQTLADPIRMRRQTCAARHRVESELSFDNRTRQLQDIYRELVDHRQLGST